MLNAVCPFFYKMRYGCVLWKQHKGRKGKESQMCCVISYITQYTHTQGPSAPPPTSSCLTLRCADAGLWFKQTEILGADRPLHSLAAVQWSFFFFFFFSLIFNSAVVPIEVEASRAAADLKASCGSDVTRSSGDDGKTAGKNEDPKKQETKKEWHRV